MRPPENDEGRPRARAALNVETGEGIDTTSVRHTADTVAAMHTLVNDLDHHHQEVTDAYVDGFNDGWDVGYGHRIHQEETAWQAARAQRGPDLTGVTLDHRALDRAYAEGRPCNTRHASGCSRCIRADAVERHGGDYTGGPVQWEPRNRGREVA